MNAESLVDKGFGLIREISEQNAEKSSGCFPAKKDSHIERVGTQFPVERKHFEDSFGKGSDITLQLIQPGNRQEAPHLALSHRHCVGRPEDLIAKEVPVR